jgi:hypothetical protein
MLRRRPHQDELLRRLTAEADHAHQLGMATLPGELEVAHFGTDDDALVASRRQFLRRAGSTAIVAGAVAVPLGAVAQSAWAQDATTTTSTTAAPGPNCDSGPVTMTASDEQIVVFAESVERAAVAAYGIARANPALGPAARESARIFEGHHDQHGEALRCLVAGTGQDPNAALVAAFAPQLEGARSGAEIIELLRQLESAAAATYLAAISQLETAAVAGAASTILPVEAQHEVVWSQYLDLPVVTYVPAFQSTDGAVAPA